MILFDANAPGPNPVTVRQFVLERGGLTLDVEQIDLANLKNRDEDYVTNVNSRGTVPALKLDDGTVLTEITAICAYLDEVADGGTSLFGDNAKERGLTNMWTRRVYLEICHPITTWWRGTDDAIAFYQGHRIPATEAQGWMKAKTEQGLASLDKDLEGKTFICNDKITMADIILNGFLSTMGPAVPWFDMSAYKNIAAWHAGMGERASSQAMFTPLAEKVV